MPNEYLNILFNQVFERPFVWEEYSDRIIMQKLVYLLQSMGVSIGNYSFKWSVNGPHSLNLEPDIYSPNFKTTREIVFSPFVQNAIIQMKNLIKEKPEEYNLYNWMICLSSVLYLKQYMMAIQESNNEIVIEELERKIPHLNNHEAHIKAVKLIEPVYA